MPGHFAATVVDAGDATIAAVNRFNDAFNRQDLSATMEAMTDDCVFENTYPAPDGTRYVGREAVQSAFEAFFQSSPQASFEVEEIFAAGDRCVVRWRYGWVGDDGVPGHVRGVDLFQVRDSRVSSKMAYVKG